MVYITALLINTAMIPSPTAGVNPILNMYMPLAHSRRRIKSEYDNLISIAIRSQGPSDTLRLFLVRIGPRSSNGHDKGKPSLVGIEARSTRQWTLSRQPNRLMPRRRGLSTSVRSWSSRIRSRTHRLACRVADAQAELTILN
jgi:hypothetical protein